MYQDLSTHWDSGIGPVKKSVVNLPIRLKGNSKHISGSSLSPSGAQMKDVVTAVEKILVNNYSSRPNGL